MNTWKLDLERAFYLHYMKFVYRFTQKCYIRVHMVHSFSREGDE